MKQVSERGGSYETTRTRPDRDADAVPSAAGPERSPPTDFEIIAESIRTADDVEDLRVDASPATIEVAVLGTFSVRVRGEVIGALSVGTQRLLAFLALADRAVGRTAAAGTMWPDANDHRAGDSLRSALSRLEPPVRNAVLVSHTDIRLGDAVGVDLRRSRGIAGRLLQLVGSPDEADFNPAAVAALSVEAPSPTGTTTGWSPRPRTGDSCA